MAPVFSHANHVNEAGLALGTVAIVACCDCTLDFAIALTILPHVFSVGYSPLSWTSNSKHIPRQIDIDPRKCIYCNLEYSFSYLFRTPNNSSRQMRGQTLDLAAKTHSMNALSSWSSTSHQSTRGVSLTRDRYLSFYRMSPAIKTLVYDTRFMAKPKNNMPLACLICT